MAKKLSSSSFKVSVAPESGADATTYWLLPSTTQVKRKADGTHLPEYVSCECFSKTGNGNPVSGGGTIKFVLIFKTGSVSTEFLYKDRYKIASDIASISFRLYVGSTQVDEKTVTVVDDGQQGETGVRGRMPFPSGAFDLSATYTATDSITPIVYYEAGKTYYVMNRTCTVTGLNPATDYAQNGSSATWIPFENYKAIFTEILMANFAKLASAVFCGDYMMSQQGKDANGINTSDYTMFDPAKVGQENAPFTPNILMDFAKGKFTGLDMLIKGNSTFEGLLKGVSGSFKNLYALDDNGLIKAAIGFNSSQGKLFFEGDMQQQGTYKNPDGTTRSYRFLTADLWCRNEFGHAKMTSMSFTSNNDSDDYFAHIYGYGNDTAYHKYPESGQPIDCIVLDGSGNYGLFICDSGKYKAITVLNDSDYPKRVVVKFKTLSVYTLEARRYHTFITGKIDTSIINSGRVNDLTY